GVIVSRSSLSGELGISRGSAPLSVDLSESHIAAQTGVLVVLGESIKTLFFRLEIANCLKQLLSLWRTAHSDPGDLGPPSVILELVHAAVAVGESHRSPPTASFETSRLCPTCGPLCSPLRISTAVGICCFQA